MIYLLNKAGIETYPIVLSTRDNCILVEYSPGISKFNYVVAYVDHQGFTMMLDAAPKDGIPGILPEYCLNGRGLLVKKDNEQWFTLNTKFKALTSQYTILKVSEEGSVTGTMSQERTGYDFLQFLESFRKSNEDESKLAADLASHNPELEFEAYKITARDASKLSIKDSFEVDFENSIVRGNNEIYVNPFALFEYRKNPLVADSRRFPLDFSYPREFRATLVLDCPPNFQITRFPTSTRFATPDGGASFTFFCDATNGKLTAKLILKIDRYLFAEDEYLELRQFFTEVVKVTETPIQLTKK